MFNCPISIGIGDHLAPGTSPGVLSLGNLKLFAGSTFDAEISSAAAGQFDQASVTGSVTIDTSGAGVALNLAKFGNLSLHDGDELIIIKNDGDGATGDAVQGHFAGMPEGFILSSNFLGSGVPAKITYQGGDGNDVAIVLSYSLFPWHNFGTLTDDVAGTNGPNPDGSVAAGDVLTIINYINANGSGPIPADAQIGLPIGFVDTDPDNQVVAQDVLKVINYINAGRPQGGEAPPESAAEGSRISPQLPDVDFLPADLLTLMAIDLGTLSTSRRLT